MQIRMNPLKGVRVHERAGMRFLIERGSPMTVYPTARVSTLGMLGKFAAALVAVVVIQGIFSFKFRVFGFFDLPLIFSVYYGFTLGNPVASIAIGSSLGLMQDSLSGAVLGANGLSKTIIGFLAASAGSKFAVDQPVTRLLALFLFTIGDGILVTILSAMVGPPLGATYSVALTNWALSAIFNAVLGLVLFAYHDRWSNATT